MTFVGIAAGTAIVGTGIQAYKAIDENSQANAINKSNVRPTYTIPQEYYQNLNIANQLAQQGIPQQQYNNQVNSINQNQAGGIAALNGSSNPGSGVASVVGQSNKANANLNAADSGQRLDNLRYAMQVRGQLAQQKLAQQQYNLFDKYTEQFNKAAALQGASNQNFQGAVSSASGLASGLASNDANRVTPAAPPSGRGDFINTGATSWGATSPQQNFTPTDNQQITQFSY